MGIVGLWQWQWRSRSAVGLRRLRWQRLCPSPIDSRTEAANKRLAEVQAHRELKLSPGAAVGASGRGSSGTGP
jgi:hypothetical protein